MTLCKQLRFLKTLQRVIGQSSYLNVNPMSIISRRNWCGVQMSEMPMFNKMNNLFSLRNEKTIVEIDSLYLTSKLQLMIT